jgi:hypothetical protein
MNVRVDTMVHEDVILRTKRWISSVVIGLNLCPFARRVFQSDLIRYVVCSATHEEELLAELGVELQKLTEMDRAQTETTLLIHPHVLENFLDFNDFLASGNRMIDELGLRGTVQLASFHPEYQFAGTDPDDVENFTNRSPYPMLHLLREESIAEVAGDSDGLLEIPERNIKLLKSLGRERMLDMLKATLKK